MSRSRGHEHGHGHGHGHTHAPDVAELAKAPDHRRRLMIAVALTVAMVIFQGIGAWVTGSLAQLVDKRKEHGASFLVFRRPRRRTRP